MSLHLTKRDYFADLISRDKRSQQALEMLVDDIHVNKEVVVQRFLAHSGSEDFLWGILRLLSHSNSRVAGNAAYILGTIAENEFGTQRIVSIALGKHAECRQILPNLTQMLLHTDAESVMNAAGTIGTLAESAAGRRWLLTEPCLNDTISHVAKLLDSQNLWTASNAALVLARLTIAEEGCSRLLALPITHFILTELIRCLGNDEAGRGMNAAFAVGRVCDKEEGRHLLLSLVESEHMITALSRMLRTSDLGASKNACFALSCLASSNDGHARLVGSSDFYHLLSVTSELLHAEDSETGWFAAMLLHTLASKPAGCRRLRQNVVVMTSLQAVQRKADVNSDLQEEIVQTLELLKPLDTPQAPSVEVLGPHEIRVSWIAVEHKNYPSISYKLFTENSCVYHGVETTHVVEELKAYREYSFSVQACADDDASALSEQTTAMTHESVPGAPYNVQVMAASTTQVRLAWQCPQEPNGIIKGYYVYLGDKQVEFTTELGAIISGLQPCTVYETSVCACTVKGRGERATIAASTLEMGAHAPQKPDVLVRGRNELQVSWKPPEVPLGRLFRYDCQVNGEVMFSGTDLHCIIHRLKADTEYTITVVAVTSEGKCESKPTKKRTAKDGYEGERVPLYQAPPVKKEPIVEVVEVKEEVVPKPEKKRKKQETAKSSYKLSYRKSRPKSQEDSRNFTVGPATAGLPTSFQAMEQKVEQKPENKAEQKSESRIEQKVEDKVVDSDTSSSKPANERRQCFVATVSTWDSSVTDMQQIKMSEDLLVPRDNRVPLSEVKVFGGESGEYSRIAKKSTQQSSSQRRPSKTVSAYRGILSKPQPPSDEVLKREKQALLIEDVNTAYPNSSSSLSKASHRSRPAKSDLVNVETSSVSSSSAYISGMDRRPAPPHRKKNSIDESTVRASWSPVSRTVTTITTLPVKRAAAAPSLGSQLQKLNLVELGLELESPGRPVEVQPVNAERSHMQRSVTNHVDGSPKKPHQWQPVLPVSSTQGRHDRFIPMQLRVQPANLPVLRQTSPQSPELTDPLASRSKSDIGFRKLMPKYIPLQQSNKVSHSFSRQISAEAPSVSSDYGKYTAPPRWPSPLDSRNTIGLPT